MKLIFIGINIFFMGAIFYYAVLAIIGVLGKLKGLEKYEFTFYPSIDVLIPSHNEGIVMSDTLTAMSKLDYKGKLKIYLLNDNSTDETAAIGEAFQALYPRIHHIQVPPGTPKGKSRVLNYGLSVSDGEYFVVYDADNQPNSDAVEKLMEAVLRTKEAVGAVGTVRTINASTNILTRMIAIEFQVFQLILQAGRWYVHQIGSLPGTNMMLKRSFIEEIGGYDEYALAEDAELTIRIASQGKKVVVEPASQTWEQEPESLNALIKQRTRWLQGNLYLIWKVIKNPTLWKNAGGIHLMYYTSMYLVFPFLLVCSNILFILGIVGIININIPIPFLFVWFLMYYLYTTQLIIIQWFDNTLTIKNLVVSFIMYFTYAQLFIFLLFSSIVQLWRQQRAKEVHWEKTIRVKNPRNK